MLERKREKKEKMGQQDITIEEEIEKDKMGGIL